MSILFIYNISFRKMHSRFFSVSLSLFLAALSYRVEARDAHDIRSVVGNSCTQSGQCQMLDPNSLCDLVNGVCDCQDGLIAVRGRCQATSELGQRCLHSSQCLTPDTVCKQNYCACRTGLVEYNGVCVKHLPELPTALAISGESEATRAKASEAQCRSDHECPTNYCLLGKCICPPGTLPLSNRDCGNVLNMPCNSAGQCRALLSGSICDVSLTKTCVCDDGFVSINEGRHCVRVLGSNCKTTRDCATSVRNSECKEVKTRMQCSCIAGLRPNFLDALDGSTRCQETIGAPCTVDVQCNTYVSSASCQNFTCACDSGYQYDPITMSCAEAQEMARLFFLQDSDNNNIAERLTISISGAINIDTNMPNSDAPVGQRPGLNGNGNGITLPTPQKGTNTDVAIVDPSRPCTFPDRLQGCVGSRCLFEGFSCDAENSICKKVDASNNLYRCVCLPGFQSNNPLRCVQSTGGGGGGTGGQGGSGSCPPQQTQTCPICPTQTVAPPTRTPTSTNSPFFTSPTPSPFSTPPRCGVSPTGIDPFGLAGQRLSPRADEIGGIQVNFTDSNLVVGGTDVSLNQICWQVGLQNNKGGGQYSLCGGSIIGESWILTAGHCVVDGDTANDGQAAARDVFVVIGSLTNQPGQTPTGSSCSRRIRASRVIVHPAYKVLKDASGNFQGIYNDITLVELEKPIGLATTPCACQVCLANKLPAPGEVGVISGYGCQTSDCSDQASFQPRKLQYARLAFVPDTSSSCFGTATSELAKDYICVGGKSGVDACPGDSGGPFAAYDQRQRVHYQVGVASFVVGNSDSICAAGNPARYTEVPHYLSWIQQYVPDMQIIQ